MIPDLTDASRVRVHALVRTIRVRRIRRGSAVHSNEPHTKHLGVFNIL